MYCQSLRTGSKLRAAITLLVLVGQFVVTIGYPTFPTPATAKRGAIPFPCQERPCGCESSEQCWAGDCCCFSLEEKLAWAEANGVEPPEHVRALVAQRQKQTKVATPKKACCCCEEADNTESLTSCCTPKPASKPAVAKAPPTIRWVVGVFAQKCRGEGPQGLFFGEPSLPIECSIILIEPTSSGFVPLFALHPHSLPRLIPTPPPRHG